jgi:hypothetical protein
MAVLHRTWVVLALFGATSEAEADPCTPVIHSADLPAAWQQAVDTVNGELATRTDIERCVDIDLRVDSDRRHASVVIALGERRALRIVAVPVDLRPTVLALLLQPQPAPPDSAQPDTIDGSGAVQPPDRDLTPAKPAELESAPKRSRSRMWARDPTDHGLATRVIVPDRAVAPIAVDVGIAIGAVWTDGGAHPSVAAAIRESRGRWSAGVFGRLATSSGSESMASGIPGAPATTTAMPDASVSATSSREVGAELGRRFELGPVALTVSAGPCLAMLEKVEASAVAKTRAVRVGGSIRVEPASMRHAGLYFAVDASANLGQLPEVGDVTTGLPTWSLGATLGGELRAWP